MRATLSVAIVCKNAARTLRATLESARALGGPGEVQIVALDSGSTDATLGLLGEFGAEAHHVQWRGFTETKNEAMARCAGDWVLNLDADESLTPGLQAGVRDAVARNDPAVAAYEINRKVWWDGPLQHAWQPEWRLRLCRRGAAEWGGYEPHSSMSLVSPEAGRIARLAGDLRHDAFATMEEFLAKQVGYSRQAAESYLRMGRKGSVGALVLSPVGAWCKQVFLKQAWRDGRRGMACASAVAVAAAMKHAILLEISAQEAKQRRSDGATKGDATRSGPAPLQRSPGEERAHG